MIQNLNVFVSALGGILVMSFLLMFLPAIVELKRPKDAGPRLIVDFLGQKGLEGNKMAWYNLEDASKIE
jgi:hypothetical protein